MKVVELVLLAARLGEDVDWGQSGGLIWHVIVEEYRVMNGHRPK